MLRAARIVVAVVVAAIAGVVLKAYLKPLHNMPAGCIPTAQELMQVEIPDETPQIMCFYTGFTVSFNPAHHVPNYVAWELTADETQGAETRSNRFAQDTDVLGCATLQDYRGSGYDRGHMAPAADMKWNAEAMNQCHLLTNIVPQDRSLNAGRWNALEQKCRTIAQRDSAIIIITGPVLSDRIQRTIGQTHVAVPERFFKVICAPYANPPRAIGFIMPNRQVRQPLQALTASVDQVEEITGFDFFSAFPDSMENIMESTYNPRLWGLR